MGEPAAAGQLPFFSDDLHRQKQLVWRAARVNSLHPAPMWRNGRRNGLKIRWAEKARAGSNPAIGSSNVDNLSSRKWQLNLRFSFR
jgi:hypothetical protein